MSKGRAVNYGGSALARELGVSAGYISIMLTSGMTADQIRAKVKGNKSVNRVREVKKAAREGRPTLSGYVPSRRVLGKRDKTVPVSVAIVAPDDADDGEDEDQFQRDLDLAAESFVGAQRRKMVADADAAETKAAQMKGELIPKVQVQSFNSDMIVAAREILCRIPGEVKDRCAAETDPAKIERLIDIEVRRALDKLKVWGV